MNSVKINVKYTTKDFKDFFLSTRFMGIIGKMNIAISLFFLLVIGVLVLNTIGYITINPEDTETISFLLFSVVFLSVLFTMIGLFPFFVSYFVEKRLFFRKQLQQPFNCIEVTEEKITVFNSESTFTFFWNDVYKVEELKPVFLIYVSFYNKIIIPKRCFVSQEHLVNFRRILYISKLDKRKLKLKNYELKKSSPDYGEVEFKTQPLSEYSEYIEENAEKNPELELDIIFEKKDILKMSFARIFSERL